MSDATRTSEAKPKWVLCWACNGTGWIEDEYGPGSCITCGERGLLLVKVKKND